MFEGITIQEFRERFQTEDDCLNYLMEIKWGEGYNCPKCDYGEYFKGKKWYYRRCKECGYDESATAGTLFHKCKLGLLKAFEITFRLSVRKKGMSSCELAREFDCQQRSAWLFKTKLQKAMKSSGKYPLKANVEVDEFVVGGFEEENRGRKKGKKRAVVVGIEKVRNKKGKEALGRAYAKVIDNFSSENLEPFFAEHVSKDSSVKTDKWTGYFPLKKDWNIRQKYSNKGSSFPLLHTHITNIKNWLRGIHHKCSVDYLQGYLDEYHYRFNRRTFLSIAFGKLMERVVMHEPSPYYLIRLSKLNT
jgi:transposase-like protein